MSLIYPPMDYEKVVQENLSYFRKNKGLTQEDVGPELGITGKGYSKYERGETFPSLGMLIALCNLYEIHFEDLFTQRAEKTEGVRTTANVFTQDERDRLDKALSSVLRGGESVVSMEYGNLLLDDKGFGRKGRRVSVPFRALNEIIQHAESSYMEMFCKQLRKAIDDAEYASIKEEDAPVDCKMAELLDVSYESCMRDYELMWMPVLKAGERNTPCSEDIGYPKNYRTYESALPFHSFRDIMFLHYFTGNDPLAMIRPELEALRDSQEHPRFLMGDLYLLQKMRFILEGDIDIVQDGYQFYQEVRESGRRMNCFQQDETASRRISQWMDRKYLEHIQAYVMLDWSELFSKQDESVVYDVLSHLFIEHRGDAKMICKDIEKIQLLNVGDYHSCAKEDLYKEYLQRLKEYREREGQNR